MILFIESLVERLSDSRVTDRDLRGDCSSAHLTARREVSFREPLIRNPAMYLPNPICVKRLSKNGSKLSLRGTAQVFTVSTVLGSTEGERLAGRTTFFTPRRNVSHKARSGRITS